MRDELRRTEAAMAPHCSQDPRPLFRPPYGGSSADVLAGVGAAGYAWTVMWDVEGLATAGFDLVTLDEMLGN